MKLHCMEFQKIHCFYNAAWTSLMHYFVLSVALCLLYWIPFKTHKQFSVYLPEVSYGCIDPYHLPILNELNKEKDTAYGLLTNDLKI